MTNHLRPMEPPERVILCALHDETGEVEADATHWLVNDDPNFPYPVPVCLRCGQEQMTMEGDWP